MRALFLAGFGTIAMIANASADVVTVERSLANQIVIPTFDSSLGTLQSVNLEVTLLSGAVLGSSHDHATYLLTSTNVRSENVGLPSDPLSFYTSAGGSGSLSITTPSYSGGGLNIGSFAFATQPAGAHNHLVNIEGVGFQNVTSGRRLIAEVDVFGSSGPLLQYGQSTKSLEFSGEALAPFLGGSDIAIATGPIVPTGILHNHSVPSFTLYSGSTAWSFSSSTTSNARTSHGSITPNFHTAATFTYQPVAAVPEPSSLALMGLMGVGLVGGTVRRRWGMRKANG